MGRMSTKIATPTTTPSPPSAWIPAYTDGPTLTLRISKPMLRAAAGGASGAIRAIVAEKAPDLAKTIDAELEAWPSGPKTWAEFARDAIIDSRGAMGT